MRVRSQVQTVLLVSNVDSEVMCVRYSYSGMHLRVKVIVAVEAWLMRAGLFERYGRRWWQWSWPAFGLMPERASAEAAGPPCKTIDG